MPREQTLRTSHIPNNFIMQKLLALSQAPGPGKIYSQIPGVGNIFLQIPMTALRRMVEVGIEQGITVTFFLVNRYHIQFSNVAGGIKSGPTKIKNSEKVSKIQYDFI